MSINIQWVNHASFKIAHGKTVVYIDPWKLKGSPHDATAVKPGRAVPYHWGDIVGDEGDAAGFSEISGCEVTVLRPGGSLEL